MSKKVLPRGRGRPKTNPTSIHLTLLPDQLAQLDAFIAEQDDELTRAEGVRRILDQVWAKAEEEDVLGLAELALRAKNIDLKGVRPTPQLMKAVRDMIETWTKVQRGLAPAKRRGK